MQATVHNEGADISYVRTGSGPLLLMITGGGGIGAGYAPVAERLADAYTVVRYDRRCSGASTGDKTVDLDMAQQARDAVALMRAVGSDSGYVFGNSGGAVIGLRLAAEHPDVLTGLVAHEPPSVTVLPDGVEQLQFHHDVHRAFEQDGVGAAFELFTTRMVGVGDPAEAAQRAAEHAKDLELDLSTFDPDFFWLREYLPFVSYRPEIERIRANHVPMVTARGELSGEAYYARTSSVLADAIGCACVEFPSHHGGFGEEPEAFAEALGQALASLGGVPYSPR